jgi:hypothetical protein
MAGVIYLFMGHDRHVFCFAFFYFIIAFTIVNLKMFKPYQPNITKRADRYRELEISLDLYLSWPSFLPYSFLLHPVDYFMELPTKVGRDV